MSLVEAIEHIRISQRCDSIEALRQLKREVNDGMVQVQWEDSDGPTLVGAKAEPVAQNFSKFELVINLL